MARTISQIQQSILDAKAQQAELSGLNSPSQTAIYRLWAYVTAVGISLLEQIMDIFIAEMEAKVAESYSSSERWLKAQTFKFQYSATNPQVVQLDENFAPTYPVVDPSLRIITRCSVSTDNVGNCLIKIAKNEPPEPLSGAEQTAFTDFLFNGRDGTGKAVGIGFAGVNFDVVSQNPDLVYLVAEIFYAGQYQAVIADTIKAAIVQYLKDISSSLQFDNVVRTVSLIDYLQAVPGFVDINISDFGIRDYTGAPREYLIQSETTLLTSHGIAAGYAIPETNSGETLDDTLTFTSVS